MLKAGVEIPATRGLDLLPDIGKWGDVLVKRVEKRLKEFFPSGEGEVVATYLFANAVPCPRTGRLVPLLTDKWLRKTAGKEAAVRMVTSVGGIELREPRFEVILGREVDKADASTGTMARGKAVSPYDNLVIDGDYIKEAAQSGDMSQLLYAVAVRKPSGERTFRAPNEADLQALQAANRTFDAVKDEWFDAGILPTEEFPEGNDLRPKHYGLDRWVDFFTPRQALVHGTFGEEFARLVPEVREALGEAADQVLFELALMQGKALNYNSRLGSWHVSKQVMRSVFERHDFAFKWTFAEFEGATALYSWCLDQLTDAYGGIARLLDETGSAELGTNDRLERQVTVTQGSAASLTLDDGSVTHICMDPPYYNNVMYAELADFFYVWEKRTLGRLVPDYFRDELTDKDNEAVANPARFAAMGRRKNELADLDYESKMTSIFAESRRVLADDGVLSVMFTHKRAEAWDTLGMGLLQAGFTIETSWPVNTEAETSLHQANMNSAASTIMLVCRKREDRETEHRTYLDDIEQDIRLAARDAATRFQHDGIDGVDLLLSTYGPTLSVISQNWPVYSSAPDADGRDQLLRPEDALALAREEIVDLRRSRLVGQAAKVDGLTDFVLLAWDTFGAREFPFDTARLLALAVGGLDVDELERAKIVSKASGKVKLLTPKERLRREADSGLPGVTPEASSFEFVIDAVDTALYIAEVDGQQAAKRFLDRHGYTSDAGFISTLQGLANAIPRTKVKGAWVLPEAGLIDTLCTLYFDDVVLPEAEEMAAPTDPDENTLFDVE
ncbi:Adenine-specific DNA methylase containing a Zn-ribbon [Propionibacterium freudenreichii]|nr:Adenine-specific DNA methylase containing a Zn-ribbon [Propionibacterium freudenreichii]SCQ69566.1 Adenine-specific DNA methylase containing a Zn-ribbon [Propionibacterium freudenreichii]